MRKVLGVAALVAATGAASGQFMTMQTQSFGPQAPDFTIPLTFNQYDGDIADLISIEIIVNLSVQGGNALVDNDSATPATVNVEFGTSVSVSSMDVSLVNTMFNPIGANVAVLINQMVSLDPTTGDPTDEANNTGLPDSQLINGPAGADSSNDFVNSAVWGGYVGMGTFDILVDGDTEFSISGGTGVSGGFSPQTASGEITVIYKFIPAPSTAALLGLAGLVGARRRR